MTQIEKMVLQRKGIEDALELEIKRTYPVGCIVEFSHCSRQIRGGGIRHMFIECEVVDHGYGGVIILRNRATGKARRVDGASTALRVRP